MAVLCPLAPYVCCLCMLRSSLSLPAAWHNCYQNRLDDHSSLSSGDMSHQTQQTSTELALAFSLDNPKQPCQQPVYAFLPMRSYGLRFVLQADWQMPSSREAVDADSAWNQALRDQVPDMLLAAMEAFSNLADDHQRPAASEDPPAVAAGPADQTAAAGTGKAVPPADSAAAQESQAHNAPAEHAHVQEQQQQQQGPALQKQQQKQKESVPKLAAQLSHAGWLDCWLRCLPVEGEAQGFFAALPYR